MTKTEFSIKLGMLVLQALVLGFVVGCGDVPLWLVALLGILLGGRFFVMTSEVFRG